MRMNNSIALNPQHSVVVEACAGSGKTWLLVSRILRLLLAGVRPSEILAITFTRKAAQEMQARLHEWLHLLATQDDAIVKNFLKERDLHDVDSLVLARARGLYRDFLLAQPALTISTFHGWFMQVIQRAPLNSGVPVGMQLLERTSALHEEAWQAFAESLRATPDSETSQKMQWLFAEYGLHGTYALLEKFISKRAEWWAYTQGQSNPVAWAAEQIRIELDVNLDADPIAIACEDVELHAAVLAFVRALATGTEVQCDNANKLQAAWEVADPHQRFSALSQILYTKADEPRSFKPTKKQNAEIFLLARDVLFGKLQVVRDALGDLDVVRLNAAALHCGVAYLEHYQEIKLRQQHMDFTDVEWQACCLLKQSDCAEYMQYKLDSRYRHVLLDEFQDTNPVQWQILQAWFAASAAVESRPTIFVVGDPKQSIYRFRRADTRLFGEVSTWLQQEFGAHYLSQNVTRRNAPAVLQVVNGVFAQHPDGLLNFDTHTAHHQDLPGHVEILPLAVANEQPLRPPAGESLRNPLTTPRSEKESGARELEAEQFAEQIAQIVTHWSIQDEKGISRRATYRDIMVLVRKRTHLKVYEHALRTRHIPFLSSRRGGLLDTLEAEDLQALLTFMITPFADLELAQTLRSPIFSCTDDDLMLLAQDAESGSWWMRLKNIVESNTASPLLQRAHRLLFSWQLLADKLPVHDLLDRIYFEGDLVRRYAAALPPELHETVRANLQAFIEIALNVDAGRYPSLPRFLVELKELRLASDNESPDEGKIGDVGNALRIYTVHEAKGLEAPIVWLLDANDVRRKVDSYDVLLDWPPNTPQPVHFSLHASKCGQAGKRKKYFDAEENYAQREEMNLLYVAMTRAKQALLVSGNGEMKETSWYGRIAAAAGQGSNPLLGLIHLDQSKPGGQSESGDQIEPGVAVSDTDDALRRPIPTGKRAVHKTAAQQQGIWLHMLLQYCVPSSLSSPFPLAGEGSATARERVGLQQHLGIPPTEMDALWQQAQHLLAQPDLQRYFDPQQYRSASNEMQYVNANGDLRRIDRLVEFDNEVWVLDYKVSEQEQIGHYRAQMLEYRAAMQAVYVGKKVRCAVLFANGVLREVQ